MEKAALQNSYPDGAFTDEQIKYGASILYIIGKFLPSLDNEVFLTTHIWLGIMYCFMGISLAT
jgi:hypothetical protein